MPAATCNGAVARAVGFDETGVLYSPSEENLNGFEFEGLDHIVYPSTAARRLRAFADRHWPDTAPAVTPVLTETVMTFDALMASLRSNNTETEV
jgi:hypothetical protein